ncbi:MAG: TolB family protein, partial [Dehalococcoidia bacterium]
QTAHDVRLQLQWIAEGGSQIGAQAQAPARRKYAIAWLAAGVVLGMLIAFGFVSRLQRKDESSPADSPAPVVRSVIDLPETAPLAFGAAPIGFDSPLIALSPDGTQLVYVGESDNGPQLYRRDMAGFDDPEPIPGTEGAIHPFFSPDGQWVGFLTHNKLRKVSVRGGDLQTLCEVRDAIRATWTLSDMIYFGDDQNKTIRRVPASGGEAEKVVNLVDSLLGQVLPDGRSALLTSRPRGISLDYGDILLLDLDTLETKALIDFGYDARYVPTGHLLFARGGNLLAAAFDLGRREVRGEPAPVVRDVSMDSLFGQVQVAVSDHGTLAFISGGESALGKMSWIDREGNEEFLPVEPRVYGVLDLSSDDTRLAVHVADVNDYIWIYDFRRREGRRLIGAGNNGWPVWTADGDILAFSSGRFGQGWRIMSKRVDGPEDPRELFSGDTWVVPASWSPDGRVLAFFSWPEMRIGFLSIGMEPAVEWVQSAGAAGLASFSPDGRWMAYISDETGRLEVWVRSYPDGSIVRQLSVGGGHEPVWCRACDELFYRNGDTWYASKVTLEPEFDFEPPRVVFKTDFI